MANTVQIHSAKSEALKNTVKNALNELKNTNKEIEAQMQINEASAAQKNAEIEQLYRENDELAVLKTDNEVFISKVEDILTSQ